MIVVLINNGQGNVRISPTLRFWMFKIACFYCCKHCCIAVCVVFINILIYRSQSMVYIDSGE